MMSRRMSDGWACGFPPPERAKVRVGVRVKVKVRAMARVKGGARGRIRLKVIMHRSNDASVNLEPGDRLPNYVTRCFISG